MSSSRIETWLTDPTALRTQGEESTLGRAPPASAAHALRATVETSEPRILSRYGELVARAVAGHSQQALWVKSWIEAVPTDGFILTVFHNGQPLMALPLEVVHVGPMRIAVSWAGSHANANFPACTTACENLDGTALAQTIAAALAANRPDIDALVLEQQMHALGGLQNPAYRTSPPA